MDYSDLKEKQITEVCKAIDCDKDDLENEMERGDYLVLTDSEANEKAAEYIIDSLWAFNANFILGKCGLDFSGADFLSSMQEKSCESANDFILSLVEKTCGLESFVDSAISADGRGHFLSGYDGNEIEAGDLYVYRVN
jgi:hypothetical protein